jgi:hypothetical protein
MTILQKRVSDSGRHKNLLNCSIFRGRWEIDNNVFDASRSALSFPSPLRTCVCSLCLHELCTVFNLCISYMLASVLVACHKGYFEVFGAIFRN